MRPFSQSQLKILQEVITLAMFVPFAMLFMQASSEEKPETLHAFRTSCLQLVLERGYWHVAMNAGRPVPEHAAVLARTET